MDGLKNRQGLAQTEGFEQIEGLEQTEGLIHEQYDVIVIGSGGAGLRAALAAHDEGAKAVVLTKSEPQRSGGTLSAHYSFCAVLPDAAPGDNAAVFAEDILRSGEGISDPALVRTLAEQSGEAVAYIAALGAAFDREEGEDGSSRLHLGWLAGHRYARAAHIGNRVGSEMIRVLLRRIREEEIPVHAFTSVTELLVEDGVVRGVLAYHAPSGQIRVYTAPAVIIATGGGSQIYALNTNPFEATGDGYGLALRAGIQLVDMEFVQHYPTVLVEPAGARGLMFNSGILIPKGARLLNRREEDFWDSYGVGDLKQATRDVMSKVMAEELAAGGGTDSGGLYVSTRGMNPDDFPQMQQRLLADVGIAADTELRQVAPGAHYFMGGIRIDELSRTNLPGVFAAGECSGGIHGANRLAGNALSENQVFGAIAGREAARFAAASTPQRAGSRTVSAALAPLRGLLARAGRGGADVEGGASDAESASMTGSARMTESTSDAGSTGIAISTSGVEGGKGAGFTPQQGWTRLQQVMQRYVGVVRDQAGLDHALEQVERLRSEWHRVQPRDASPVYNRDVVKALELRNMIDTGLAVAAAARERRESRGAHVRTDYPALREEWSLSLTLEEDNGRLSLGRIRRGKERQHE